MADNPATPAKKRRSSGPRTARPIFAIVTYTDDQGQAVQLDKARLSIRLERDSAAIVDALTGGDSSLAGATVTKVELPQPKPRAAANPAS